MTIQSEYRLLLGLFVLSAVLVGCAYAYRIQITDRRYDTPYQPISTTASLAVGQAQ